MCGGGRVHILIKYGLGVIKLGIGWGMCSGRVHTTG